MASVRLRSTRDDGIARVSAVRLHRRRRRRRRCNLRGSVIKFRPAAAKHCRRPVGGCFPHVPAAARGGGGASRGGCGGRRYNQYFPTLPRHAARPAPPWPHPPSSLVVTDPGVGVARGVVALPNVLTRADGNRRVITESLGDGFFLFSFLPPHNTHSPFFLLLFVFRTSIPRSPNTGIFFALTRQFSSRVTILLLCHPPPRVSRRVAERNPKIRSSSLPSTVYTPPTPSPAVGRTMILDFH